MLEFIPYRSVYWHWSVDLLGLTCQDDDENRHDRCNWTEDGPYWELYHWHKLSCLRIDAKYSPTLFTAQTR